VKTLKVLCVADEVDLLVYSSSIRERFGDIDLILSAGDLPGEYLGFIASMLNKPMISVAGNHDPDDRVSKKMIGRLSFGIRKEAGISVLGIPGSMLYNGGVNQYSEFSMRLRVLLLAPRLLARRLFKGRGVDVILAHAPPKGIHDGHDRCHQGFAAFNWLIRLAAPAFFIHGHVHIYDNREGREELHRGTAIVNVYGHRVLTLEMEK